MPRMETGRTTCFPCPTRSSPAFTRTLRVPPWAHRRCPRTTPVVSRQHAVLAVRRRWPACRSARCSSSHWGSCSTHGCWPVPERGSLVVWTPPDEAWHPRGVARALRCRPLPWRDSHGKPSHRPTVRTGPMQAHRPCLRCLRTAQLQQHRLLRLPLTCVSRGRTSKLYSSTAASTAATASRCRWQSFATRRSRSNERPTVTSSSPKRLLRLCGTAQQPQPRPSALQSPPRHSLRQVTGTPRSVPSPAPSCRDSNACSVPCSARRSARGSGKAARRTSACSTKSS